MDSHSTPLAGDFLASHPQVNNHEWAPTMRRDAPPHQTTPHPVLEFCKVFLYSSQGSSAVRQANLLHSKTGTIDLCAHNNRIYPSTISYPILSYPILSYLISSHRLTYHLYTSGFSLDIVRISFSSLKLAFPVSYAPALNYL
ncbi:hypothetical protein WAI453_001416 [Rhynchosporium graminicola]